MTESSPSSAPAVHRKFRVGLLLAGIILISANLRGAITSVGPLLGDILEDYRLSAGLGGLLTSLPLFAFAFLSPYAARLARRIGMEKALFMAMVMLTVGIGLRYLPPLPLLYGGTALIGIGIALANVLVPGLIRRDFPEHLTLITALFTMVLVTVGGLGSAVAIPLKALGGWRESLLAWGLPAILALLVWWPQLKHSTRPRSSPDSAAGGIWRSSVAWQVSLFMGCQSTAFYVMIAWFPSMMADWGTDAARAGWILFIYQIFVLAAVMLVPVMVHRLSDQRLIGALCGALNLVAFTGLLLWPGSPLLWMCILGLGCGGSLVLAMTLFGLRASSAVRSVSLSGMAQSLGYLLAAVTPVVIGAIYDLTHDWTVPLLILVGLSVAHVVSGFLAGRPLQV